jgi:hypothetical protein
MQRKTSKILRRGRIRRASEEGRERPDVPDRGLLYEVAHAHVFDHVSAQRLMGFSLIGVAPVLRWRLLTP